MPKPAKSKKIKTNFTPFFTHYLYCLAIITLLLLAGININNYLSSQKVLGANVNISPLLEEKTYWEDIIQKTPSYVDAYLELAKVNVEIGDKNEALNMIKRALILDPNSSKITKVQKELEL